MGSSWDVFLGGQRVVKKSFLPASPCGFTACLAVPVSFCFRLIAAARFALLRTGEAPLSATGFGVDFLPPFWGHLKQPVLLQGSWWRLGFFQNGLLTLQFVCATHQRVVLHQTVMLHQTATAVAGRWGRGQKSVRALRFGGLQPVQR